MLYRTEPHFIETSGELDLYSAPELKRRLSAAIDEGNGTLVVDLTQATFVDSTTLGVLVGAKKRLAPEGGSVSVVCPQNEVRRLFEVTGINRVFEIYETREEALAALG